MSKPGGQQMQGACFARIIPFPSKGKSLVINQMTCISAMLLHDTRAPCSRASLRLQLFSEWPKQLAVQNCLYVFVLLEISLLVYLLHITAVSLPSRSFSLEHFLHVSSCLYIFLHWAPPFHQLLKVLPAIHALMHINKRNKG